MTPTASTAAGHRRGGQARSSWSGINENPSTIETDVTNEPTGISSTRSDRGRRDRSARDPAGAATLEPDDEAEEEQRRKCDQVALGEVVHVLRREDAHLDHEREGDGGHDRKVRAQARVVLAVRDGADEQDSDRAERHEAGQQSQISGVVERRSAAPIRPGSRGRRRRSRRASSCR